MRGGIDCSDSGTSLKRRKLLPKAHLRQPSVSPPPPPNSTLSSPEHPPNPTLSSPAAPGMARAAGTKPIPNPCAALVSALTLNPKPETRNPKALVFALFPSPSLLVMELLV